MRGLAERAPGGGASVSSRVSALVAERPWVLPFASKMLAEDRWYTARELGEAWGVRTSVVKRALWWLAKYGLAERQEGEVTKYRLRPEAAAALRERLSESWVDRNRLVVRLGRHYLVVAARRKGVTVRSVDEGTVAKVREAVRACGSSKVKDVAEASGLPPRLVSVALRVLRATGEL